MASGELSKRDILSRTQVIFYLFIHRHYLPVLKHFTLMMVIFFEQCIAIKSVSSLCFQQ